MRLESVKGLKEQLLNDIIEPLVIRVRAAGARAMESEGDFPSLEDPSHVAAVAAKPLGMVPSVSRSLALGVSPHGNQYRLAIRLQRVALRHSRIVRDLTREARGEVDIRLVGRIDKRTRPRRASRLSSTGVRPAALWYRANARPLLIGASVGHVDVTAGSIGAFVQRGGRSCLLSNNHVLANEGRGAAGDAILQRARFDGGRPSTEKVAQLSYWVTLKPRAVNFVDAAIAEIGVPYDAGRLRGILNGRDRQLKGLGPEIVDEGSFVYKLGRTTGATKGRVTAFDLDNVVVNYDVGNLRFDGQVEIEGVGVQSFSDGGDSGALIVNARMEAVALLFAGSDAGGGNGAGLTFANPIQRVLADLKSTLLS